LRGIEKALVIVVMCDEAVGDQEKGTGYFFFRVRRIGVDHGGRFSAFLT